MRALIWLGLRPRIDTSNAAVPATCGAAMLVPRAPTMRMGSAAQGLIFLTGWPCLSRLSAKTVWLHAAHTHTSLPPGGVGRAPAAPSPAETTVGTPWLRA